MGISETMRKSDFFGRAAQRESLHGPEIVQQGNLARPAAGGTPFIRYFYKVINKDTAWGRYLCWPQRINWTKTYEAASGVRFLDNPGYTTWNGSTTYNTGDCVINGEEVYRSLQDGNLNHEPPSAEWWEVASVRIWNTRENNFSSSPDCPWALGKLDIMEAWVSDQHNGDAEQGQNDIWVGVPLVPEVRRFKVTEDAPSDDHLTCNMILNDGDEAVDGELGYGVEVYTNISSGSALDLCARYLKSGDYIAARNIRGKWIATEGFNEWMDCDCYLAQ